MSDSPPPGPPAPPPSGGSGQPPSGDQPPGGGQPPGGSPPPPPGGGYGSMPPPGPTPGPGGNRPGELLDRFVARLVDHILLAVVNGIITAVLVVGVFGLSGASSFGGGFSAGAGFLASAVSSVISVAIALGYFGFMDTSQGRTLGKMVMNLRVVGNSGANPTWEESIKRNVWIALGLAGIIPFLGIIGSLASLAAVILIAVQINNDTAQRKPWTDNFAGTQVLKES